MAADTLVSILETAAERFGPRPALVARRGYRARTWSYAELRAASLRAAGLFEQHGVEPGDRVVLWAANDPLWVIGLFGVMRLGAVAVPLDVRSTADFVSEVVSQTAPRLAIVGRGVQWPEGAVPHVNLDALDVLEATGTAAARHVQPNDLAEIIFTSGTTGAPKGVMLTHGNIAANVRAVAHLMPLLPSDRALSLLPLSHMLEQTIGLFVPMSGGGSVVYPVSRQSTEVFRTLRDQQVTAIVLVPQALQLFLEAMEREVGRAGRLVEWRALMDVARLLPLPLRRLLFHGLHRRLGGRLRFIVSGGAPLEPGLQRSWELLGVPIVQGYGTTEAAPVVTATAIRDRRSGSVGKVLPGQGLRIADDGEVLIRGPNVTTGYWCNPDATDAAFRDGWYCTGDLGEVDADGYLHLKGRKKDMIVLANGLNVYAEDVERELRRESGVQDAAVLGLAGAGGAVRIHAVLLGLSSQEDASAAVQRVNGRLAPHQRVQGVSVWPGDDFPRTATLKVRKHEILSWVQNTDSGKAPPVAGVTPKDIAHLVALIARVPAERVTPQASLGADLGLDSLARVELLAAIETECAAVLDEERIDDQTTVADLERLVAESGRSAPAEQPEWPLRWWGRALRASLQELLFFPLLRFLCTPRVAGFDHLQGVRPPVIFAANHASHLDAAAVLASLPPSLRRRTAVAAAEDYFFTRPWLGAATSLLLNAFPFSRSGAVRRTLEWCGCLLDRGWSIVVFPEGTRSTSGEIGPFRSGIGLMAVELGAPVVPVRVMGTFEALPKGRWWPRRHPVVVRFGPPLRFPPGTPYEDVSRTIEAAVRAL